MCYSF